MIPAHVRALLCLVLAQIPPGHRGVLPAGRWEPVTPPYTDVSAIAVAQDGSTTLYAAASDPGIGKSGVFRSDDFGTSWTLLADALPGETAASVTIDPRDSETIYATTENAEGSFTRLYVSADRGSTWRYVEDFMSSCGGTFAFDARTVYLDLACSGDLYASPDRGLTWTRRSGFVRSLAASAGGALYAEKYGSGTGALSRSIDGGYSWQRIGEPDCNLPLQINAVAEDVAGRLYVATGSVRMIFVDCGGVRRSVDGGSSWRTLLEGGQVVGIVLDPGQPSRAIAWTSVFGGPILFETEDDGATWQNLDLLESPRAVAFASYGRILFAATGSGLYRLSRPRSPTVVPR